MEGKGYFGPDLNMVFLQLLSSVLFTAISNIETNVRREGRDQYEFLKEKKVTEREGKRVVPMYQKIEFRSIDSALWRL